MRFNRIAAVVLAIVVLGVTSGCGPQRIAVEGRVTLEGRPLDEAALLFVPVSGGQKKTGAAIVDGRFELSVENGLLPGRYRVEVIDNPPLKPSHADATGFRPRREFPYRYANESSLWVTIKPDRAHTAPITLDFALSYDP